MLAIWTGQRQGDLLRLPWPACDGSHIRLQQSKTRRAYRVAGQGPAQGAARSHRASRSDDPHLRDVEAILDAHYLGRDVQLAEAAVPKLEARRKLETVP
jgi:hypothetical protein